MLSRRPIALALSALLAMAACPIQSAGADDAPVGAYADVARQRFAKTLEARDAASEAEAQRLAATAWARAEATLAEAIGRLERGDGDGADARAAQATDLYAAARLQSVQATVLTPARAAVVEMGQAGAAKLAPRTAARARELLATATAELATDLSRRQSAAAVAEEAAATARRAIAVAAWLRESRERGGTAEDAVLAWLDTVERAGQALGTAPDPSLGPAAASEKLLATAAGASSTLQEQSDEIEQRGRQIATLEEELRELDMQLVTTGSEARELGERLEARERAAEQFSRLEGGFPPGSAVVLRQGDQIIVRLTGLVFASGSSTLPRPGSRILAALGEVVNIYPRASLNIEGHTDASGDSLANQRLSQARADAVRRWLVTERGLADGRVTAVGYGDSRPIATNATAEGRASNRRIDVVIDTGEPASP